MIHEIWTVPPAARTCVVGLALAIVWLGACAGGVKTDPPDPRPRSNRSQVLALPFTTLAAHIVAALQPAPGERVILRLDREAMPDLVPELRARFERSGAIVEELEYGTAPGFEEMLSRADIYIWLPMGPRATMPPDQVEALGRWLDAGRGRQVHFHWGAGTIATDGSPGEHSVAYDRVYTAALDIDYAALDRQMESAIARLRSGEVRVTTPAGTDLRFAVRDRPFNKQNGDASSTRMASARIRIDREIELPAGALRVAPIEETVHGTMIVPVLHMDSIAARDIRLEFTGGKITRISAATNEAGLRERLDARPALHHFREFALGFNPKLVTPPGERWIPYYGYGAGVVRLSLGDNTELGGAVGGGAVQWFFVPDATVSVGRHVLVDAGRLLAKP